MNTTVVLEGLSALQLPASPVCLAAILCFLGVGAWAIQTSDDPPNFRYYSLFQNGIHRRIRSESSYA
jgi:hypothetical protein